MKYAASLCRRIRPALVAALTTPVLFFSGCFDSDIAKRFREAYSPTFVEGLSTALEQPGQAEAGLRLMGTALAEGLGAILEPRTSASSGSSTSARSGSSR